MQPSAQEAGQAQRKFNKGELRGLKIHTESLSLPKFSFQDQLSRTVRVNDFKGSIVVLNLWATWCGPCVKELPSLDLLQSRFSKNKVTILAVSQDKTGAKLVPAFYKKLGIRNLAVHLDPQSDAMTAFRVHGLPTTIIIDQSGREISRLVGAIKWDSEEVESMLRALLSK